MFDLLELADRANSANAWQNLSPPVQLALTLGSLALLPAALMTMTCFTRIVIVLSFVRQGLATQGVPPNTVVIGLALFLTAFIMRPTLDEIGDKAVKPYLDKTLDAVGAAQAAAPPLRSFMLRQTRKQDLALFLYMANAKPVSEPEEAPFTALVPAFVISELKTAFIMGFCIFLPFLMVDLVVSSVLTSMGMVMMPPALISAPFKVLLFVLADGWHLVALALGQSFA
jgi:flagellar biosynthesis protein FliP